MNRDWSRRDLLAAGGAAWACAPLAGAFGAVAASKGHFDPAGIAALNSHMHALVDEARVAGMVTLLAHRGRIVNIDAYGRLDASAPAPMRPDTIFQIASMTKPVVGVAMMKLRERGLWQLDDPVAKHIPEFAGLKVRIADGGLVDQASPMTMRQLMSHQAGFAGFMSYADKGLNSGNLHDMIVKLAALPLDFQPGTDWIYGPSVDVQGYLVEKLSGETLDTYLQRRIFDPLGMRDTRFWVDPVKAARVARSHVYQEGRIVPRAGATFPTALPHYLSGSGGLYSTAPDYHRFAQALLGDGRFGGARILGADSVGEMRRNVVPAGVRVKYGKPPDNGLGFGMDLAIVERPAATGSPMAAGSCFWPGAHGTHFWVDPANQIVFVGMIQNHLGFFPGSETPDLRTIWPELVYAAFRR